MYISITNIKHIFYMVLNIRQATPEGRILLVQNPLTNISTYHMTTLRSKVNIAQY